MESPEKNKKHPEELPSRSERLEKIFQVLEESHPARDAAGARELVAEAFNAVERSLAAHPDLKYPMVVNPFENMPQLHYFGRTVWHDSYARHHLILGDNGAIEIRSKIDLVTESSGAPFHEFTLVFSKLGADGRGVWEPVTS